MIFCRPACESAQQGHSGLKWRALHRGSDAVQAGVAVGSSQHPIALLHLVRIEIQVLAHLLELGAHRCHAVLDRA